MRCFRIDTSQGVRDIDRRSIRAKFDSPCRANGFINHPSSSKVIPFRFSRLTSQKFIFFNCLIQMAGSWIHRGHHGSNLRERKTVMVVTLFGIVWRPLQRKILDADEIQNFKRSKFERFSSGDKRQPEIRLRSQDMWYAAFCETRLSKIAKQKKMGHTWKNESYFEK